MALSRYNNTDIILNDDLDYKKVFKNRFQKRDSLQMLETPELDYPGLEDIKAFSYENHIWRLGSRYYKLAFQYYGDPQYWWVIAWFNKKPTEQHVALGDLIKIPLPVSEVLDIIGV